MGEKLTALVAAAYLTGNTDGYFNGERRRKLVIRCVKEFDSCPPGQVPDRVKYSEIQAIYDCLLAIKNHPRDGA